MVEGSFDMGVNGTGDELVREVPRKAVARLALTTGFGTELPLPSRCRLEASFAPDGDVVFCLVAVGATTIMWTANGDWIHSLW
jgi:hypothetical protein